ncbi:hypothetical protein AB0A63_25885 [Lentzea sp. NPDC042327]|uniref:hypothetical protein n=1 Tax=Lentzea sp. NPDC042327 TaxID=3154801 RepID=UPI0033E70A4C
MSKAQLVQITAMPGNRYELAFLAGGTRLEFSCTVDDRDGIALVSPEPWLMPTKPDHDGPDIEDRRAVIEAVLAVHRAHRS